MPIPVYDLFLLVFYFYLLYLKDPDLTIRVFLCFFLARWKIKGNKCIYNYITTVNNLMLTLNKFYKKWKISI